MPINISVLEKTKYPPELFPSCEYCSPTAGTQANIIDIPVITPALGLITKLSDVGADRSDNAELRFRADARTFEAGAWAFNNLPTPTPYNLFALKAIRLSVYAYANLTNYRVWHGLWAWRQTVADKLALKQTLTPDERRINEEYGISKTVGRGTLPAKVERMLLYEYFPMFEETHTIRKDVPTTGIEVETLRPTTVGENFVCLTRVSCDRSAATDNVRLVISRDEDTSFITLHTWVTHLDYDIPCFIPALRELRLNLATDTAQTNYCMRYTYSIFRLTNILRVRFGLVAKDEVPGELWDKVKGGIC